jgi:hypothetical protein
VYLRSLIVFVLCTVFVLAFVVVLNYEQGAVLGSLNAKVQTTRNNCQTSGGCDTLTIVSAALSEKNYSSDLGPGSYAILAMKLNVSGPSSLGSLRLFIDNSSGGTIQGPVGPGPDILVNLTLPATIAVTHGMTYTLSVEGLYGTDTTVVQTLKVVAQ